MNEQETQAPEAPGRENGGKLSPGRPLHWLTDKQAIIFGNAAAVILGLGYWNFRASNAVIRFVADFGPRQRDFEHLLSYGLPVIAVMMALLHGLPWWAAKRGLVPSRREGLVQLSRCLWPAIFMAVVLVFASFVYLFQEVRWLLWAPFVGLSLGMMAWQVGLWRERELPATEPLAPRQEDEEEQQAEEQPRWHRPYLYWMSGAVAGIVAIYTAWFGYLVTMRHFSIGTALHDFGIYDQLMYNTIQGRWFEAAMFNMDRIGYHLRDFDNHFFAEHFIPTFWIVTPFYWLFPHPVTVLMAQTVLLALAAVPVYLIALNKLRSPLLGVLFAGLFLMHPLIQQTNIKDIHIDSFAPVFLLGAFAAYLYKRMILFWVLTVLALGVKEEISVNVAAMGAFIFMGERDRKIGAVTFALGAAWFLIVIGWVMPYFRDGLPVRQIDRYGHLIPPDQRDPDAVLTKGMVLKAMLTNPGHLLGVMGDQLRIRGAFILLSPFALLGLWGRWAWLWILPMLAAAMLSGLFMQYEMIHHYGVTIVPAVTVASIYGAWWLLRRDLDPKAILPLPRVAGGAAILLFMFAITWYEHGFTPGGKRYDPIDYRILPHNQLAYDYLAEIPDDAAVSAQLELGGQLTQRRYIYCWPEVLDAEYIFLDTRGFSWPVNDREEFQEMVEELLHSEEWGLKLPYEDGYLLFKKGHPTDLNMDAYLRLDFSRYRPARYGGA